MEEKDREADAENGRINPAASADAPASPRPDDEDLRRYAVARLADHLEVGVSLAQRCEHLAAIPKGDRVGPISAAARLMNANARVAEALANVAQVERRRRSIVETIQKVDKKKAELNSGFDAKKYWRSEEEMARVGMNLWKRLNAELNETIRARTGDATARDIVKEKMESEEQNHAKAQEKLAELDGE